ncbi:MAG TPA: hypothetical protein VGZ29_04545 [Terriglobia bacterium]|nr:hypothetical protein [Terriglobia bacterium]
MAFDPTIHHRRSIRLRGYDYSQPGAYFVTVGTEERRRLFGEVVEDRMVLNLAGQMVQVWCHELPRKFAKVELDCAVVMPNHIHAVVQIVGADLCPQTVGAMNVGADLRVRPRLEPRWFHWFTTTPNCWEQCDGN